MAWLSFQVEHYILKMDIISYYLLPTPQHWYSINKNKIAEIRDVLIFGLLYIHYDYNQEDIHSNWIDLY